MDVAPFVAKTGTRPEKGPISPLVCTRARMVEGNANGAGLCGRDWVLRRLQSLSTRISPLSPGSCSHGPGDSVGGGGDSPAKPPL